MSGRSILARCIEPPGYCRGRFHQCPSLALAPAPNAANAVGLPVPFLAFCDQICWALLLSLQRLPLSAGIVFAAAHFKHLAYGCHTVLYPESFNPPIFQMPLLLASDRKFRSGSTYIRSLTVRYAGLLLRWLSSCAGVHGLW